MTTALEGGEGSASLPGRSLPSGKTRYPLYRRLGGPQGRSGQVRKISPPLRFEPRTDQPVAQSLYRLRYPVSHFHGISIFVIVSTRSHKLVPILDQKNLVDTHLIRWISILILSFSPCITLPSISVRIIQFNVACKVLLTVTLSETSNYHIYICKYILFIPISKCQQVQC